MNEISKTPATTERSAGASVAISPEAETKLTNEMGNGMDNIGIFALAKILCDMNPYTGVTDTTTGETTMSMEVGTPLADEASPACQDAVQEIAAFIRNRIPTIKVEVERNYGTTWNFKGQPATIKTAFRVPYTFKVMKNNRVLWQQTEHMLIGFAGAAGGG